MHFTVNSLMKLFGCGAGHGLEVANRQLNRQHQHPPLQRLNFAPSPVSWRDMNSLLLTGGRVIDPANRFDSVADILISDRKIVAVGGKAAAKAPSGSERMDAK